MASVHGTRTTFIVSQHTHAQHIIEQTSSLELAAKMTRTEYIFKGEGKEGIAADVYYQKRESTEAFPIGRFNNASANIGIKGIG